MSLGTKLTLVGLAAIALWGLVWAVGEIVWLVVQV